MPHPLPITYVPSTPLHICPIPSPLHMLPALPITYAPSPSYHIYPIRSPSCILYPLPITYTPSAPHHIYLIPSPSRIPHPLTVTYTRINESLRILCPHNSGHGHSRPVVKQISTSSQTSHLLINYSNHQSTLFFRSVEKVQSQIPAIFPGPMPCKHERLAYSNDFRSIHTTISLAINFSVAWAYAPLKSGRA
ncbi:hypothetical protein RRG08_055750 [Elysia crispata]|uniref:Uncharacterized protein n=1 Tax=Elysia crispata TaxID=231223 RepID=A0AAE1ABK4_9GAST|nr:hypothetical protein RRG08_055750 [Elysia crispata]